MANFKKIIKSRSNRQKILKLFDFLPDELMIRLQYYIKFNRNLKSRDFTYIDNVILANLLACKAGKEAAGEVYNIAYGGREYLIDIYKFLNEVLGKNIDTIFGPARAGDIRHSNADISKARKLLGYEP